MVYRRGKRKGCESGGFRGGGSTAASVAGGTGWDELERYSGRRAAGWCARRWSRQGLGGVRSGGERAGGGLVNKRVGVQARKRRAGVSARGGRERVWGWDVLAALGGWSPVLLVVVCLPTCRLFDFPAFRLFDFSTCWKVGKLAGCGSGRDVLAALGTGGLPRGKTEKRCERGWKDEEVAQRIQAGAGGASAGWVAEV